MQKKRGNLLYTLAMIVFAAIFLISGGLLVKRFLDDRKTESEFADLQSMIASSRHAPISLTVGWPANTTKSLNLAS